MKLVRRTKDRFGYTHYRYQQYHGGVIIQDALFTVHEHGGRAVKANGRIVANFYRDSRPTISKQQALELGIRALPMGTPAFQDDASEMFLRWVREDTSATHFPNPSLMFTRIDDDADVTAENLTLAYQISIPAVQPLGHFTQYIDARTGHLVKSVRLSTGCFDATANTVYNGEQTIRVSERGGDYVLEGIHNDCDGTRIRTSGISAGDWATKDPPPTQHDFTHGDLDWSDDDELDPFAQAHWSALKTYEYFETKFNYHGYDNEGATMLQLIGGLGNLNWKQSHLLVAIPNPDNYPDQFQEGKWGVSLDVVGHEWTHAITHVVTGLGDALPTGEFGALYESFGDIFGSMVECYAKGLYDQNNQHDCEEFIMGEEYLLESVQRSMIDPHSKNHPDT